LVTQIPLLVLVVDDDTAAANGLSRLVRACGHTVHVSYDPLEGIELASAVRPHLILHDIAMPSIDGYEAARRLRRTPQLAHTVLIACSATVDEQRARQCGFDGWLLKPISDRDLSAVITKVLHRNTDFARE
jgi:two-component system CheB/CheR fusion protein